MKKNIKQQSTVSATKFDKKLSEAKESYRKIIQEIAPFTPKQIVRETSTEGKWQSSNKAYFY